MFFSAVIVVVLALIVYTEQTNATATASVWVVTHNVAAGTPYSSDDVQLVQVRAGSGDFNYQVDGPRNVQALFARSLVANDILRTDDLIPVTRRLRGGNHRGRRPGAGGRRTPSTFSPPLPPISKS